MSFFNWLKSKAGSRAEEEEEVTPIEFNALKKIPPADEVKEVLKATPETIILPPPEIIREPVPELSKEPVSPFAVDEHAPSLVRPTISVPLSAFVNKVPAGLLVTHLPDRNRSVQIAEEDLLYEEVDGRVAVALSILSLSCPEIFVRAITPEEDEAVSFSLHSLPPIPAPKASSVRVPVRSIIEEFPPDLETPAIREAIQSTAFIEVPLTQVEPQLKNGRVTISAASLRDLMPAELKERFAEVEGDIPIPLKEVYQNLPAETIQRRSDQEVEREEKVIATPFTLQTRSDAVRFEPGVALKPLPDVLPPLPTPPEPRVEKPVARTFNSERLQAALMTDELFDLKEVIEEVAKLPGLRGCLLSNLDGDKIIGNLGGLQDETTVSNRLEILFQKARETFSELELGGLETLTFASRQEQFSTFLQGTYCLTVRHENRPFRPGVREKIQAVMNEISEAPGS